MSEENTMTNPLLDDLLKQGILAEVSIGLPMMAMPYPEGTFREGTNLEDIPVGVLRVMEENTFRDPFLLARGKAIPKMIRHLCPDILVPENLTEVDVEAILLAARLVRFGPRMKFKHTCQNPEAIPQPGAEPTLCRFENDLRIDLQEFILRYSPFTKLSEYRVTLPRLNQIVQLRPLRYGSRVRIMLKMMEANRRASAFEDKPLERAFQDELFIQDYLGFIEQALTTDIESIRDRILFVENQNGDATDDPEFIMEWIRKVPADMIGLIRDEAQRLARDLRAFNEVQYQCGSCGHPNKIRVQLDPQRLFMPAEVSDQPRTHSAKSEITGKKGKTHSRISRK